MIIRLNETPVRYYTTTSDGRAGVGDKGAASRMNRDTAEVVLKHLRIMDRRWQRAEIVDEDARH